MDETAEVSSADQRADNDGTKYCTNIDKYILCDIMVFNSGNLLKWKDHCVLTEV